MDGGGSIFDQIGRAIESLWKAIIDFFAGFGQFIANILSAIGNAVISICEAIGNIVSGIVNGILNGLGAILRGLFVPQQSSVDNLVNSVSSKFGFIDTIKGGISAIQTMVQTNENLPVLSLTLPQNNWVNGSVTVMDLNWYSTYKPYGDLVISAFIYVFFAWRLYISLSSIITGAGGSIHNAIESGSVLGAFDDSSKNNIKKG